MCPGLDEETDSSLHVLSLPARSVDTVIRARSDGTASQVFLKYLLHERKLNMMVQLSLLESVVES